MKLPPTLDLSSVPVRDMADNSTHTFTDAEPFIARNPKTGARLLFCCGHVQNKLVVINDKVQIRKMGTWYQWFARPDGDFGSESVTQTERPISDKQYTLEEIQAEYEEDQRKIMEHKEEEPVPDFAFKYVQDSGRSTLLDCEKTQFTDHQRSMLESLVQTWIRDREMETTPFSWMDIQEFSFLGRMFVRKCEVHGVKVSRSLGAFLVSTFKSKREVILWIWTLYNMQRDDNHIVSLGEWLRPFGEGIPVGDQFDRLWERIQEQGAIVLNEDSSKDETHHASWSRPTRPRVFSAEGTKL